MAHIEFSDSDGSTGVKKPRSRASATESIKTKETIPAEDAEMKDDEGEQENGEDEEEYEIEAIIDAKRGKFKPGEYAYFVKWKGYEEKDNSWVAEADAGNATELIDEFFKKKSKAVGVEKRVRGRASAVTSRGKAISPTASTASGATKRSRVRPPKVPESASVSDEDVKGGDEDEPAPKPGKKQRTGASASINGTNKTKRGSLAALDKTDNEDDDVEMMGVGAGNGVVLNASDARDPTSYTTMRELNLHTMKSWEDIVEIQTVEEAKEGGLMVYLTTKSGKHVRETASKCAQHCPQKLIKFYESHLKWRHADDDVEA